MWIYKGDILPYRTSNDDKIRREAAMAAGESAGEPRRRQVVSAGGGKRKPEAAPAQPGADSAAEVEVEAKPIVGEASPELEALLAEEEAIERNLRQHHETPHFRPEAD